MSKSTKPDFFTELAREIRQLRQTTAEGWLNLGVAVRNRLRAMRRARLDYVILPVGGPLPERNPPPRSFIERQLPLPSPPLSFETLNDRLRSIADAGNVKGVIFVFRGFSASLATLQNFRQAVERLRAAGKEAVVYTPYLDLAHYYAATAADRIVIPPSTQFEVLGLRAETVFLKDALAQIGVKADVVQISPYKTAMNMFSQPDITPEQQEQLEWLLDEQYDMITAGMAAGRHLSQGAIRQLIDQAPLTAEASLDAGLVDHLAYEDDLACWLAEQPAGQPIPESTPAAPEPQLEMIDTPGEATLAAASVAENEATAANQEDERPRARLMLWNRARGLLMEKPRRRTRKFVGIVSLEGLIAMGPSRQPPVDLPIPFIGSAVAGEQTLVKLLRAAAQMDDMGAVIFHVDSGGGSALASDLISREVKTLSQKKPVLVYMGNVAASGGYYVSAPAQHIMSQSGTITGSIGVVMMRISTAGLFEKIHVNRVSLQRGAHADLYSDHTPMTAEERQIFWQAVMDTYGRFKQVVAEGRGLPYEMVDAVGEGRVWSGRQALEHRLVDSHGDFVEAVRKAAELAGLPAGDERIIRTVNIHAKDDNYVLPQPLETMATLGRWLLGEKFRSWSGQPLLLLPFTITFR